MICIKYLPRRDLIKASAIALLGFDFSSKSYAKPSTPVAKSRTDPSTVPFPIVIPMDNNPWLQNGMREKLLKEASKFLGKIEGEFLVPAFNDDSDRSNEDLVYNQFESIFLNVPLPVRVLSNGNRVYSAHGYRDASTVAFVLASGDSTTVLAIALLHNYCGRKYYVLNSKNASDRKISIRAPIYAKKSSNRSLSIADERFIAANPGRWGYCRSDPVLTTFVPKRMGVNNESVDSLTIAARMYVQFMFASKIRDDREKGITIDREVILVK